MAYELPTNLSAHTIKSYTHTKKADDVAADGWVLLALVDHASTSRR